MVAFRFASTALIVVACTTITEKLPDRPKTSGPLGPNPIPIVVVPIAPPTQAPAQTPTPTPKPEAPTPTPTPATPAPTPKPAGGGCGLPPGGGSGGGCQRLSPSFLSEVEASLDQLVREEPRIFNTKEIQGCGNCYQILDTQRYVTRLPQILEQRGLCAIWDGEEFGIKNTNKFNDQYDLITSANFIRRQGGSYRSTCYPAAF